MPREYSGILRALTALGRDLAGVLRSPAIVDHLAQSLTAHFSPDCLGIAVFDLEANRLQVLHASPAQSDWLTATLDEAMRGAARATSTPSLAGANRPVPTGSPGSLDHRAAGRPQNREWLDRDGTGALPEFTPDDMVVLEAFSALPARRWRAARSSTRRNRGSSPGSRPWMPFPSPSA